MHKHPAGPAGTSRCALARLGARMAAVSWSGPRPCRGKEPALSQAPVAVSQHPCRMPRAHPLAPQRLLALHARSLSPPRAPRSQRRIVAAQPAVSWPCARAGMAVSWPASRHSAQPPSHNTILCIAANFQPN